MDPTTAYGDSSVGSTTTSAPQLDASARRPAERSDATTVRTPRAFSQQITARPTGPQPSTIATSRRETEDWLTACSATAIGSVSTATSGDSPLGTTNDIDCSTSTCSAYPPGASGESPIGCASAATADQWERHDVGALAELAARAAPPLAHLADELVAHHGGRRGPHELVVVELLHHLGEPVAVLTGVQVRAADAAAQTPSTSWPLSGVGSGSVHDGQLRVGTRHGPHRELASCSCSVATRRSARGGPCADYVRASRALPPRPARWCLRRRRAARDRRVDRGSEAAVLVGTRQGPRWVQCPRVSAGRTRRQGADGSGLGRGARAGGRPDRRMGQFLRAEMAAGRGYLPAGRPRLPRLPAAAGRRAGARSSGRTRTRRPATRSG